MAILKFKTNLNCGNCVAKVTALLDNENEIKSWSVNTEDPQKTLSVDAGNISHEHIEHLIAKVGFKAEVF